MWLTNQLIQHESNPEEWWGAGRFDFDDTGLGPDQDPGWRGPRMTLHANWEQIPMEAD